jgi:uncharacterized protein (DUF952 family)
VSLIYKLLDRAAWLEAKAAGTYAGSPVDLADGFIHFSTAEQVHETAAKHFRGAADLMLLSVDPERLGAPLTWEPSRGGALFPHLYAAMPASAVVAERAIALDGDGVPMFGALEP